MKIASFIIHLLFVQAGLASPRGIIHKQLGRWTISNNIISCNATACYYIFDLMEDFSEETYNCQFVVNATASSGPDQVDFQSAKCGAGNPFSVNGGHMAGSTDLVLVITNVMEMTWAFFGYNTGEFVNGPLKTSPSFPIGQFPVHDVRVASVMTSNPRCGWAITQGRRVVDDVGIHIHMTMINGTENKISCDIDLVPSSGTDYETSSFYNQKCHNIDWFMSWGYQPEDDSAIMIMTDSIQRHQIWFSWTGVNTDIMLTPPGSSTKATLCGI